MKRKIVLILIFLMLFSLVISCEKKEVKQDDSIEIEYENIGKSFLEVKTHELLGNSDSLIFLKSEAELEEFNKNNSDILKGYEKELEDNTIVIKTCMVSSGSISLKIKGVYIENKNICFDIESKTPEIGTCDMASWYLIAVIPNENLVGLE